MSPFIETTTTLDPDVEDTVVDIVADAEYFSEYQMDPSNIRKVDGVWRQGDAYLCLN